jgi:hypothetical protein
LPQARRPAPAHDYLCCSAGKWILEPRRSLTDSEAPLCFSGRDKGAYGIARLLSFKPNPGALIRPPSVPDRKRHKAADDERNLVDGWIPLLQVAR